MQSYTTHIDPMMGQSDVDMSQALPEHPHADSPESDPGMPTLVPVQPIRTCDPRPAPGRCLIPWTVDGVLYEVELRVKIQIDIACEATSQGLLALSKTHLKWFNKFLSIRHNFHPANRGGHGY